MPGIYTLEGDILPIQLIDSRRLSADENLWLKDLNNKLEPLEVQRVLADIYRQGKAARIKAYLEAIVRANTEAIQEAINMSNSGLTVEQVFENVGWIAKWEARGVAKGITIGEAKSEPKWRKSEALDIAKNMISMGFPIETVASATRLDPEKVKELYEAESRK